MSSIASTSASTRSRSSSRRTRSKRASRPAGFGQRFMRWVEQRLGRSFQLRGQGLQMRLVMKKVSKAPASAMFPGMVVIKPLSKERLALVQQELRTLIRQHPQTKKLLRHLAYVERTLRREGLEAVDELPVEVLSKAQTQLETLVVNWSALGLAELRSRLSLLVKNKKILALHAEADPQSTQMDYSQRADVCEVSHSVFEEMERSWRGNVPPTLTHALGNAKPA